MRVLFAIFKSKYLFLHVSINTYYAEISNHIYHIYVNMPKTKYKNSNTNVIYLFEKGSLEHGSNFGNSNKLI